MALLYPRTHESFQPNQFKNKTKKSKKGKKRSNARKPPEDPKHYEVQRLFTFSKFPRDILCSSILLARNGFMYAGDGTAGSDTVVCVFCFAVGNNVGSLRSNEDIQTFHRNLNRNCSIVKGLDCGNKLIQESEEGSFEAIFRQFYKSRNKEKESRISTLARDYEPPPDVPTTLIEVDTHTENLPPPHQEPQSNHVDRSSPIENGSFQPLLQAVEDGASSQMITNRAESLTYPWQNNPEPLGNLDALVNNTSGGSSSSATAGSCDNTSRPDGIPSAHSNAPQHTSSNATSTSLRDNNHGNQGDRPDIARPLNQNPATPDATRAGGSTNAPIARNTSTPSSNPQPPPQSSTPSSQQDGNVVQDGVTSYDKLGIFTARPKRPEYAVEQVRLQSFEGWPDDHHISPSMLAKAGYFYTGYSDCARCFFCGGGLRNWEDGDDVWVEHARWFPKCTFIRQNLGQTFIDVVQDLSKEQEIIPYQDVITRMEARGLEIVVPRDVDDKTPELKRDVAVRTTLDNGFTMADTLRAAEKVKEMGYSLTSDLIFEELVKMKARRLPSRVPEDMESNSLSTRGKEKQAQGTIDSLISENNDLRQQSQCKICLDKEVAVVFLPCGHFVSCSDCSYALKACPICRQGIKGVVKGSLF